MLPHKCVLCKSMIAWLDFGNGETPSSTNTKGDKFVGDYYIKFDEVYKKEVEELVKSGNSEEEAKQNAPILLRAKEMLISWESSNTLPLKPLALGFKKLMFVVYSCLEMNHRLRAQQKPKQHLYQQPYRKFPNQVQIKFHLCI